MQSKAVERQRRITVHTLYTHCTYTVQNRHKLHCTLNVNSVTQLKMYCENKFRVPIKELQGHAKLNRLYKKSVPKLVFNSTKEKIAQIARVTSRILAHQSNALMNIPC